MNNNVKKLNISGVIALFVPLLAVLLIEMSIARTPLILDPLGKLNTIVVITIILTIVLIIFELNQINAKKMEIISYGFGLMLMWPIIYVLYFFDRQKYGYKSYGFLSLIFIILFLGSVAFYTGSIKSAYNELAVQQEQMQNIITSMKY